MGAMNATLTIEPLDAPLGAEVHGVDCTRLDASTAQTLRAAWQRHRLLIFRDVVRNDDDLVVLGKAFGDLVPSRFVSPLATRPEVMVVSNILVDGKLAGGFPDGEIEWHYDGMHQKTAYTGAILFAQEVPSKGGETRFADMRKAYASLPSELKPRLEGLTALSTFDYSAQDPKDKKIADDAPRAVHPIVRELPETGEKAIFVARLMTDHIMELEKPEGDAILGQLYAQMNRPEFAYEHDWRVGDAVLWDNRCVVHARNDFSDQERRLLKRVTIR
jgi:taurine dioxygenase